VSAFAKTDTIEGLRSCARRRLPKAVFDFFDGGAETETTLRRNVDDLARLVLTPRYFVDVAERDLSTRLLGREAAMPLAIAPTGLAALGWPRADVALARAAAAAGLPFVVSTSSSVRIEEIAEGAPDGARLWFQVYPYRDQTLVRSLIERAAAAGFEAIVVTVDVPVLGHRSRDHHNRFTVPLVPTPRLAYDLVRCAGWTLDIARHGVPRMQNFVDAGHGQGVASLAHLMTSNMNPGSTWEDLAWIRRAWPGPILVKGVLAAADAALAVRHGLDGVVISNHGGRQLDGGPSTVSRLPAIVDAVAGRAEIYIDGGVRSGTDIAKVVSLGATAAMVGRATLYGVAAGGEAGAAHALTLLRTGYDRSLALLGRARTADLDASCVETVS
jgi:isopentenyl diphosphate isomerase/L-lactate dehydrogenase-like FMN-dependent dehydrogenase